MNSSITDTIVALATSPGKGAIAVIRLSGSQAITIVNKCFKGKNLAFVSSHSIHYGYLIDQNEILDEVMVSIMKAPKTFTKEDVVEISTHGSNLIVQQAISLFIKHGARQATAGEFTLRAFLNGRIDLSQAEAIADLIASENKATQQIALQQMKGGFTNEIKKLKDQLIHFAALLELELDFSEEDVEFVDRSQLTLLLDKIYAQISELTNSFELGNVLKSGIATVIIGQPNVGKSTLLNVLLNEDRAIVSEIAGTTRDTIEEILNIDNLAFRLIDTAGIRVTTDSIEEIGVTKAMQKLAEATLVVYLIDCTDPISSSAIDNFLKPFKKAHVILCFNKADSINSIELERLIDSYKATPYSIHSISAKNNIGINDLKKMMAEKFSISGSNNDKLIINNARHLQEFNLVIKYLDLVYQHIKENKSTDLLAAQIRMALYHLGNITGTIEIDRDLLGAIFSKFCIGK
jgi:tRNA modification GTPase